MSAGWDRLDPERARPEAAEHEAAALERARLYADCFWTPAGERVLALLEAQTLGASLFKPPPGWTASEMAIYHLGQENLVRSILMQLERARRGPVRPAAPADGEQHDG